MPDKTRTCPQCGGAMTVRLGEFQCQQCDHSLPLAAADEDQHSAGTGSYGSGFSAPRYGSRSGSEAAPGSYSSIGSTLPTPPPGLKTPPPAQTVSQHDPGAQFRNAPPPPGSGQAAGYLLGADAHSDIYKPEKVYQKGGTLDVEKMAFFVVMCVIVGLTVIGFMAMGAIPGVGAAPGVIVLISGLITLALYYWVLFGEEMWAKYTCLGCTGLNLLGAIGSLFTGPAQLAQLPQLQGTDSGAIQSFVTISGFLQIAWIIWFLSILWRDVQKQQV